MDAAVAATANVRYGLPQILEKTLYDLHTIGQINRGEKISTTNEYLNIEEDNFIFQPFGRSLRGDNRDKAVKMLCYTVNLAVEYGDLLMESRYFGFIERYARDVLRDSADPIEMQIFHTEYLQRKTWIKLIASRLGNSITGLNNFVQTYQTDGNVVGKVQPVIVRLREYMTRLERFIADVNNVESNSAWYKRFLDNADKDKVR